MREKLCTLEKTVEAEDIEKPKNLRTLRTRGLKLNVISGKTFGMTREGIKIMSIISVVGHQVVSEPFDITLVHLDIYANCLRGLDPTLDSRAVRASITTVGPRLRRVDGHYMEIYGPYPISMNKDGINIYTNAH